MEDIYFNPTSLRPKATEGFAGLAGGQAVQDQELYGRSVGLQNLMQGMHASTYAQDEPVRQSARLKDIYTNKAEGETVGPRKQAEVKHLQLGNQYDEGTMGARIAGKITESDKSAFEFKLQKMEEGLKYASIASMAMREYGPAGAAQVVARLKKMGMDVQDDPVVNYMLSGHDAAEIDRRIKTVHQAYDMANKEFRNKRYAEDAATNRTIIQANSHVTGAEIMAGRGGSFGLRLQAYSQQVQQEHPDWPKEKVQAEAVIRADNAQYGIGRPTDNAQRVQLEKRVGELQAVIPYIPENTPLGKRLRKELDELRRQRTSGSSSGATAAPAAGGAGTAQDPIKLD